MKQPFGALPSGEQARLYTIRSGRLTAQLSDFGATLVRLYVPDAHGNTDDVVLGFDDCNRYRTSSAYFGATIGRNANRIGSARFLLGGKEIKLPANDHANNLHSGPDSYAFRMWQVARHEESIIEFFLLSPDGDQGFPGNAEIRVIYKLEPNGMLRIIYDGVSDKDTVFNLTNHSYFNLAGHQKPALAMDQTLILPSRFYAPSDAECIPTGQICAVAGTPMDFREPKPIGQDLDAAFAPFLLQGGYDHTFEVFTDPCAILHDPSSGRTMTVSTDRPGIHIYSGNFLADVQGKDGVRYCRRSGVALETQCYPDSVNNPQWVQPFVKAGQRWHSETRYIFKTENCGQSA